MKKVVTRERESTRTMAVRKNVETRHHISVVEG